MGYHHTFNLITTGYEYSVSYDISNFILNVKAKKHCFVHDVI